MQAVIDELLIGIAKETLSLRCVEVHPVRGSKVYGFFLNACACMCAHACVLVLSVGEERMASLVDETHLMTFFI